MATLKDAKVVEYIAFKERLRFWPLLMHILHEETKETYYVVQP